jgi:hypothetical protein
LVAVKIYVAGPYTKGDVATNVRAAIIAADNLRTLGHTPYIPHLSHFWHLLIPHEIDFWYALDMEWLEQCDALFRIEGESVGADREEERARELGLIILRSYDDLPLKGW